MLPRFLSWPLPLRYLEDPWSSTGGLWAVNAIGTHDKLGTDPMAVGGIDIDISRRGKREEGKESKHQIDDSA